MSFYFYRIFYLSEVSHFSMIFSERELVRYTSSSALLSVVRAPYSDD